MKITLENWLRNKIDEVESMHEFGVSTDTVRCWIEEYKDSTEKKSPHDALLLKIREMEIAAETMEKTSWKVGANNTAMTSNGAKIAYRAVIGLIEKSNI